MKKIVSLLLVVICMFTLVACSDTNPQQPNTEQQGTNKEKQNEESKEVEKNEEPKEENVEGTILLAVAASLKNCMDNELIPLFNEQNPKITINTTYDSSGKLQTQIEEGAEVDVFMSAAMKQMNALKEKGLMAENSIVELLENKIVLILSEDSDKGIDTFEKIVNAETVAVGDPESVPAGQYAKEALEKLGLWEQVLPKSSFGTNVTEVLNWVVEGSADAGIVYATDAASSENVTVIAEAPEGSVSKVIYPVGMVKSSVNQEAAELFIEFLQSDEAITIFVEYGFSSNK